MRDPAVHSMDHVYSLIVGVCVRKRAQGRYDWKGFCTEHGRRGSGLDQANEKTRTRRNGFSSFAMYQELQIDLICRIRRATNVSLAQTTKGGDPAMGAPRYLDMNDSRGTQCAVDLQGL